MAWLPFYRLTGRLHSASRIYALLPTRLPTLLPCVVSYLTPLLLQILSARKTWPTRIAFSKWIIIRGQMIYYRRASSCYAL
ncbi:MAG: hypothetical protein KatS3mg016_0589 [Fimbriimonadales bacterium]|nr:MAG: hypothetical protein KatS3mg016_0589 [Fimbriimonadales bacterium]GIV10117.1 MAG: hypothetical protein KatS3mg019_2208 [Fimbriimonadales bacterium]